MTKEDDTLYKAVHWIGVSVTGLPQSKAPEGSLVSDSVITLAIREFRKKDGLRQLLKDDPDSMFKKNFLVNSLSGETMKSLGRGEMFRAWMIFTLYLRRILFSDNDDPRGVLLGKVLQFASYIFHDVLAVFTKDHLHDPEQCAECPHKEDCDLVKNEQDTTVEETSSTDEGDKKVWN